MVNIERLKAVMKERNISIKDASDAMGMDEATYYRRMKGKGEKFTLMEVEKLAEMLDLEGEDVQEIFFSKALA